MPWDDFRHTLNKKLDDFGDDALKKVRAQREANVATSSSTGAAGLGAKDRLNLLKGENPRWNADVERRREEGGGGSGGGGGGEEVGRRLPPVNGTAVGAKGRPPPPPPLRRAAGSTAGTTTVEAAAAAAPAVPPRMANENGTPNPPPPYVPTPTEEAQRQLHQHQHEREPTTQDSYGFPLDPHDGHVLFSRFGQEDKEAFWALLDEYFDQKQRGLR